MTEMRGRAWRRAQARSKGGNSSGLKGKLFTPEKNWKFLYLRSEKLARVRQLGVDYPKKTVRQKLDEESPLDE